MLYVMLRHIRYALPRESMSLRLPLYSAPLMLRLREIAR